jgi:hypothetical protein
MNTITVRSGAAAFHAERRPQAGAQPAVDAFEEETGCQILEISMDVGSMVIVSSITTASAGSTAFSSRMI